ncbi:unnamed protein product, partial [Aphanomyces euteiches]
MKLRGCCAIASPWNFISTFADHHSFALLLCIVNGRLANYETSLDLQRPASSLAIYSATLPEPFLSWTKKHGGALWLREFTIHSVLFTDPVALQHMLIANGNNYPRLPIARAYVR